MKKLIALALALVLTLSMAVCVFAADITSTEEGSNSASAEVKGNYVPAADAPKTISVGIDWVDAVYTFTVPANSWDTTNHTEVSGGNGSWTKTGDFSVTVTNDGNVAIVATVEAVAAVNTVEVSMDKETLELAVAPAGTEGTSDTSKLTVSGTLAAAPADGKIATVTVTIAEALERLSLIHI